MSSNVSTIHGTFIGSGVPLRVHHVAKLTGLAPSSVRWNATKKGLLPFYRDPATPKILLFRFDDVLLFIERRTS